MNEPSSEHPREDRLRRQLWELVYDLLPEEEADALIESIGSDPLVARTYAEVKLQAGVVGDALRHEEAPLALQDPAAPSKGPAAAAAPPRARRRSQFANLVVPALAASLLLLVSYSAWQSQRFDNLDPTRGGAPVRTTVLAPAAPARDLTSPVTTLTRDLADQPVSVPVEVEVLSDRNERLWYQLAQTDAQGQLQVSIPPAYLDARNSVRFQAAGNRDDEAVMLNLVPQDLPASTYLMTDRPSYEPGETLYFRSVTAPKLATAELAEQEIEYELAGPDGQPLPGFPQQQVTQQGVASGTHVLDENAAEGLYSLIGRSPSQRFREVRRPFVVRRDRPRPLDVQLIYDQPTYGPGDEVVASVVVESAEGQRMADARVSFDAQVDGQPLALAETTLTTTADGTAQLRAQLPDVIQTGEGALRVTVAADDVRQSIVRGIPLVARALEVLLLPEGGRLVAEVPNRLYFAARSPLGEPVAIAGRLVAEDGTVVAPLATEIEGRGVVEFTPSEASYRVELDVPQGWRLTAEPLVCSSESYATINTGPGVFDAGAPIDFTLLAREAQRPVLVAAASGGVDVGQIAAVTAGGAQPQLLQLPVADAAQGVLRLTLYDVAEQPPQALAERLVYRRPPDSLQISAEGFAATVPEQRAQWRLAVSDQQGQPAPATLGVAVVGGSPKRRWGAELPAMQTYFSLLDAIDSGQELEHADLYLAEHPAAARALDLLLGVQGWRQVGPAPQMYFAQAGQQPSGESLDTIDLPQVADNLPQLQNRQAQSLAIQQERIDFAAQAARWVLPAALLLLVVVLAVAALRVAHPWVWIPSLGIAAASLLVAFLWLGGDPSYLGKLNVGQIAVAPESDSASDGERLATGMQEFGRVQEGATRSTEFAENRPRPKGPAPTQDMLAGAQIERSDDSRAAMAAGGLPAAEPAPAESPPAPMPPPAPAPDAAPASRAAAMSDRPPPESPAPAPPAPAPGRSADSEERALPALAADHQLELLEEQQGGKQKTDELARDPAELAQRLADSRAPAGSESRGGSRIRSAETAPQATRQFSGRGAGAGGAATSALESQLDRTSRDDALTNRAQVRRFMFRGGRSEGESAPTGPPATVLWDPLIQASDGTATAEFDVPPDTQTLQLLAFAHAGTRFGTLRETVTVNPPVSLETHELAGLHVGDTFQLPVVITNRTTGPVELGLKLTSNQLLQPEMAGAAAAVQVPVPAQSAVTYSLPAQLAVDAGAAEMSLETSVSGKTLAAKWRGDIAPAAPVVAWDTSGVLTSGEPQAVALELPAAAAEVDVQLRGWPSVAAELRDRVRSLGEALSPADPRLDEFADSVRLWNRNYGISDPDLLATASRLKKLAADNATAEASLAAIDNFRAETLGLRPPGDPQRSNAALKFEARESAAEGLQQLFESEGRSALTTGPVTLDVHLDQQQLAELQVPGSSAQSLTWHDRFDVADQGPAALGLTMQGAEQMPYRLNLNAYLAAEQVKRLGPGQDSLGFQVDTHLSTQAIRPGEATDLVLQLRRAEPRTIQAVVPLPGGVELDQQQARDELARAGLILQSRDKHRLRLTWPAPDPGQATDEAVEVRLRLRGVVPGRYTAPPATAYETGQRPGFAQPLTLEIASP